MDKIKVFALMGKSASGKDTIMQEVLKCTSCFNEIISCTSRPKRDYEINGKNYHFLTEEEFLKDIEEEKFIEFTAFNGWLYGTRIDCLSKDRINIGVFNPAGIYALLEDDRIDLTVFYVEASDKFRLIRQLSRENDPDIKEIFRRYNTDEQDFKNYNLDFEYFRVENNNEEDFATAIGTIISFI